MKLISVLICYFVQYYVGVVVNGEYHISAGIIPSYLFRQFNNVNEQLFPREIEIKFSLSTFRGTLLYTMDRNMNQLIVTLSHVQTFTLEIEFNTVKMHAPILELCGCSECRYRILDLRIRLGNALYVRCNKANIKKHLFGTTKQLNYSILNDYPIPYRNNGSSKRGMNEAQMWLVNFPRSNNVLPNYAQLSGCILDVIYNNEPVVFTEISDSIERRCIATCVNDACNGGKCYETYNLMPLCDCADVFLNGLVCNDPISSLNIRSIGPRIVFTMFKVSWQSYAQEIMILENKRIQIRLVHTDSILRLSYIDGLRNISKAIVLDRNYDPNNKYILFVNCSESDLQMKLKKNELWNNLVVITAPNITKERFTTLTLRSGHGVIDFVFKLSRTSYKWRRVNILESEMLDSGSSAPLSSNFEEPSSEKNKVTLGIGLTLCIGLLICIICGVFIRRKCKRRQKRRLQEDPKVVTWRKTEGTEHDPLLPEEKTETSNDKKKSLKVLTEIFFKDYRKDVNIGKGTFGEIFKCINTKSEENIMMEEVTIINQDDDLVRVEKCINVYKTMVSHPRIVGYLGTNREDNIMRIFMEYVSTDSVKDHLNEYGPLTPDITVRYAKQVLEGLDFLHRNNIIHGDLRCYNLLRDAGGNVKLRNFGINMATYIMSMGIAKNQSLKPTEIRSKGKVDSVSNPPTYWMAPEVIRDSEHSKASDVWSLGATIIEMLTGTHPNPSMNPTKALIQIAKTQKIEYEIKQQISQEIKLFIDEMLEPDSRLRASVNTLLESELLKSVSD